MVTALTLIFQSAVTFSHFRTNEYMNHYPLLSLINSPEDLRLLNKDQLPQLCQELRSYLLESVSQTSGHLASGLGTVELTVALHYILKPLLIN